MTTAMTDYAGLVDLPQWPPSKLYDRTSYYAGVNAMSFSRLRRRNAQVSFEKVKAHQNPDSFCRFSEEWKHCCGNNFADAAAKTAALSHNQPSGAELQLELDQCSALKSYLVYVSRDLIQ